jgi:IPT/TIG domain
LLRVRSHLELFLMLAVASAVAACGGAAGNRADPPPTDGPRVLGVTPDSVLAGESYPVVLTIRGERFDPEGNFVRLGNELTDTVPSTSSTSIRWVMPKSVPSGSEAPPRVVQPGRYELTVQTHAGRSNPVVLTLLPGG